MCTHPIYIYIYQLLYVYVCMSAGMYVGVGGCGCKNLNIPPCIQSYKGNNILDDFNLENAITHVTREFFLKGKAQYGLPPCTN